MHTLRSKITFLIVCAIVAAITIATFVGVYALRSLGNETSDETLLLLCETGEKNLDYYFSNIERSVEVLSSYADEDLKMLSSLDDEQLAEHINRVESLFEKISQNTGGVLTYYYRIDPSISTDETGFWYTNLDGGEFEEHEPTDISIYDTNDTSQLVWFTVPKNTGKSVWLPPYVTDNLDVRVLSYNVPIYWNDTFIGVVGIEIDYSVMAEQVDSIELYDNGYAFINDSDGTIIYHPRISVEELTENHPKIPNGLISNDTFLTYEYNGVEKRAVWLPLENGMRLNVSVPTAEINAAWYQLIIAICLISAVLLAVFIFITVFLTNRITRPLHDLADAAKHIDEGNYDFKVEYSGDNEIGTLTRTFNQLTGHLKTYIGDLNDLAYADALTSVRNKGAYDIFMRNIQEQIDSQSADEPIKFAIGIFDCDNLKIINDQYGHDKGNIYLTKASHLICRIFQHTPVFRIGGDEFAIIMQHEDYENYEQLLRDFIEQASKMSEDAQNPWEEIHVSSGIAVYNPKEDAYAAEVARRADKLMYENKHFRKQEAKNV